MENDEIGSTLLFFDLLEERSDRGRVRAVYYKWSGTNLVNERFEFADVSGCYRDLHA
jgi:hypothetical protein